MSLPSSVDLSKHSRRVAELSRLYKQPSPPSTGNDPTLNQLTNQIEKLIQILWTSAKSIDRNDTTQLTKNLTQFEQEIQEFDSFVNQLSDDYKVPTALIQLIDNNQNPDLYTKLLLSQFNLNDTVRGKMFATKALIDRIKAFQQLYKEQSSQQSADEKTDQKT